MNCLLLFVLPAALCASIRQTVHNATHGHHDPVATFQHHLHLETEKLWQHMDFNLDGNFGRDDLQHFIHDYDTNHDGEVTKAEFKTHWTHDDPSLCMVADGLFIEFDSNADGFVDDKDLTASYNKVDINKDGHVEKHEFKQYWTEVLTLLFVIHIHTPDGTTC